MSEKQLDLFESIEKASQKTDNTELSGVITLSKKLVEQSKIVEDLTSALKEETKKLPYELDGVKEAIAKKFKK